MKASLYALQRQLGLMPGGPVEEAQDPAMQEFIEGVTALVQTVIAKKAAPAAPKPLRVAAIMRELEAHAAALAPYVAPLPPRQSNALPIESKVVARDELGRIKKVETTAANGRVVTSTARRDSLGRMTSILHEMADGRDATARIKRDAMGRIAGLTMSVDGQADVGMATQDANTALVGLLIRVVEDAIPADPLREASFAPGRNPLPRAYVQRNQTGEPAFINIANRQIPISQVRTPPTNVSVQFDAEGRPYVTIRHWRMRITHDFSGLVQSLDPLPAE